MAEKKRLNSRPYIHTLANQGSRAKREVLIIIDSNSLIHRAFHALPPLTTKKGELVNAVYGFLLVFLKAIKEFQPDYIVATFDFPAPTFRHKKYKEYKITRPPTPKELSRQIPKLKEVLKAFGVPIFEKKGFEADDLIGTISKKASQISYQRAERGPEIETIVLSGDLDILQLVDSHTKAYTLRRGVKDTVLYNVQAVQEKYQGLNPEQLLDFKGLRGDPSDNIPGVPGIGEKTAIQLIKQFENLENLYQNLEQRTKKAEEIKPKIKSALIQFKKEAFFSRMLVEIKTNVAIGFSLKKCRWGKYDKEKVIKILRDFEFYSLIKRLLGPEGKTSEDQNKGDKSIKKNLKLL